MSVHFASGNVCSLRRSRRALADAHGVFLRTDWEYHTARFMRNVWMNDFTSLNDLLRNPTFTKCSDKRLSIDLAALRQMVWLTPGGELLEKIGSDQPDMVRWIDTSCMVADCLTKRMRSDRLSGCLRSGWLDLIPTDESVFCKMKKQKERTNPDGSAGDLDRNDHFDQWRSYMKELLAEWVSSIRHSDDESYGCVRITVFCSAIVI